MSDIIHNMEHPMISELRAQMEVQQGKYESELAEKQEKIEELEADISDLDSSFGSQYKFVDNWVYDIKEARKLAEKEGKPMPKFTLQDLSSGVSSFREKMYGSCAINIVQEFAELLELVEPTVEYVHHTDTKTVYEIPSDVKSAMSKLKEVIDNYI